MHERLTRIIEVLRKHSKVESDYISLAQIDDELRCVRDSDRHDFSIDEFYAESLVDILRTRIRRQHEVDPRWTAEAQYAAVLTLGIEESRTAYRIHQKLRILISADEFDKREQSRGAFFTKEDYFELRKNLNTGASVSRFRYEPDS